MMNCILCQSPRGIIQDSTGDIMFVFCFYTFDKNIFMTMSLGGIKFCMEPSFSVHMYIVCVYAGQND